MWFYMPFVWFFIYLSLSSLVMTPIHSFGRYFPLFWSHICSFDISNREFDKPSSQISCCDVKTSRDVSWNLSILRSPPPLFRRQHYNIKHGGVTLGKPEQFNTIIKEQENKGRWRRNWQLGLLRVNIIDNQACLELAPTKEKKTLGNYVGEVSRNMLWVPKEFAGCISGSKRSNKTSSAKGAKAKCS